MYIVFWKKRGHHLGPDIVAQSTGCQDRDPVDCATIASFGGCIPTFLPCKLVENFNSTKRTIEHHYKQLTSGLSAAADLTRSLTIQYWHLVNLAEWS